MDIPTLTPGPILIHSDESQRVKFLCSFSGSILPRPQDRKLRYVGGETRIISVPRDITFEDLMSKMRELFETATVLKYQQPDEDLDSLVSVVNDDDVTNMMEEYDKVGAGDGFTRLRLFLFTSPEQDSSSLHFGVDGDERDHERRYVDALNSLTEPPDFRKNTTEFDDEQYFNQMSLDGEGVHGMRINNNNNNMELPMDQMNLRHLTIPHLGSSGQMEAPWSPAYYSPRLPEFPTSPSSSRYRPTPYEQPPYPDSNVVLMTTGNDKAGFPGNVLPVPPSVCENCRLTFQRNQVYPEPQPPPPQLETLPSNVGGSNGYFQIPNNSCAECVPNPNPNPSRELFILNSDQNLHHPQYYCRDHQNDPRAVYSEAHCHDRGWVSPHQPNPWGDSYVMDNGMNINVCDVHHHYIHHEDHQRYGSQVHLPSLEDRGARSGHPPPPTYNYGPENQYQVTPHSHIPPQSPWRNVHNSPFQVGSPFEESVSSQLVNSSVLPMEFFRENSPMLRSNVENQNTWTQSSQKVVSFNHVQAVTSTQNAQPLENYQNDTETNTLGRVNGSDTDKNPVLVISNVQEPVFENSGAVNETNATALGEDKPDDLLEFLPELIASVKEAALESLKVVKAKVQDPGSGSAENHKDGGDENVELEAEDDTCKVDQSKIERTKAEEEAIDRGLQTIRNEDLEDIKELGSGTYGSVYHGKWKGSNVAIKRIKASCFAGRPSERERLIADFWKEALILSSLHHPNVVSFYGVVRDGPDGSLATVTEFMVNGSLKQFLQKKDRTIDRRKRLIIAMDTAFGMEYLHGKNIVHFDLKCENLLVNMRDPHRPVCKIGDLGLSKVKQHTLVSGGVRGTLPWMAPELLSGKSNMVTEKIDVYSYGICMWELLTGDEPYTDMHCANIIGGIVNNTLRPQIPTWCDPEWKAMMEGCWASEPDQRPSFSEIAQKLRNMAVAMNLK